MVYRIDAAADKTPPVIAGHLKMGGRSLDGTEIAANSRYLTRGDRPWLPVMGEFHFSRYPESEWLEELLRMKAGSIQIVSTYVFWIHHEEIEGYFQWSGNRDLRRFIELAGLAGLYAFVRIGPWCHGECRNGGFPDWLLKRCRPRTNDPDYLRYVRRLFSEIAGQLEGFLYAHGGPVIGIQLENELHDNPEHLLTLKEVAIACGLQVPLYTVTGWGGAGGVRIPRDEVIPAFGTYPDHPWEQHTNRLDPGPKYFFHCIRNDQGIGVDLFGTKPSERPADPPDVGRYPYITCEIGPGVQVTHHRRPIVGSDDVGALSLVKLGSGANLMGYYVFHGGSNPIGRLSTLQESKETGYPNDLPIISYDFQAPLGEYGQVRESYRVLKLQHLFLADFGEQLAPMAPVLPQVVPRGLGDVETVRLIARVGGGSGFLFFNNHQRHTVMPPKKNLQVQVNVESETLTVPRDGFTLKSGAYFIWPINMDVAGTVLRYATAQPLCRLSTEDGPVYVFFQPDGIESEYVFAAGTVMTARVTGGRLLSEDDAVIVTDLSPGMDCLATLTTTSGECVRLLTLTAKQALNSWKGEIAGREHLLITKAAPVFDEEVRLYASEPADFTFFAFPDFHVAADGLRLSKTTKRGLFQGYLPEVAPKPLVVKEDQEATNREMEQGRMRSPAQSTGGSRVGVPTVIRVFPKQEDLLPPAYFSYLYPDTEEWPPTPEWVVDLPAGAFDGVEDILLRVDYVGDVAHAYINGRLVADDFYKGRPWEIGLKRFRDELASAPLVLKVAPFQPGAEVYLEMEQGNFGTSPAGDPQPHSGPEGDPHGHLPARARQSRSGGWGCHQVGIRRVEALPVYRVRLPLAKTCGGT